MLRLNDTVLRSAYASKVAYAPTRLAARRFSSAARLHGPSFEEACYIIIDDRPTGHGGHAYVWHSGPSATMVAFRGSHEWRAVARFMDVRTAELRIRDAAVRVHAHTLATFSGLEPQLTRLLMVHQPSLDGVRRLSLTFCGHSAGGGLAMLAAAYYGSLTHGNARVRCHTFGAPGVGDAAFVRWYESLVDERLHVRVAGDPVPRFGILGHAPPSPDAALLLVPGDAALRRVAFWEAPMYAHDMDTYIDLLGDELEKVKLFL